MVIHNNDSKKGKNQATRTESPVKAFEKTAPNGQDTTSLSAGELLRKRVEFIAVYKKATKLIEGYASNFGLVERDSNEMAEFDAKVDKIFFKGVLEIVSPDDFGMFEGLYWELKEWVENPTVTERFDTTTGHLVHAEVPNAICNKLCELAPTEREAFEALSDIFDIVTKEQFLVHYYATSVLFAMGRRSEAPHEKLAEIMVKCQEYIDHHSGEALVDSVFGFCDRDGPMCKVIEQKVADLDSESNEKKEAAQKWLDAMYVEEHEIAEIREYLNR